MTVATVPTDAPSADGVAQWLARLERRPLPLFAATVQSLRVLQEDSGASVGRLCNEWLLDPGFAVALLKRVNSGRRGGLSSPVGAIQGAALLLGVQQLKQIPRGLPQLTLPAPDVAWQGYMRAVSRAYHAAYQAYDWATSAGDKMPMEIFEAAFLSYVGELGVRSTCGDHLPRIKTLVQRHGRAPADAETAVLGCTLSDLTKALVAVWRLPRLVIDAMVADDDVPILRTALVRHAVRLADCAEYGWYTEPVDTCLETVAPLLELPVAEVARGVHRVAVAAARDTLSFAVRPAAALLIRTDGPEPEDELLPEDSAIAAEASAVEPAPVAADTTTPTAPEQAPYERIRDEIEHAVAGGRMTLRQLMAAVMRGFTQGLGLSRVVFAMLSRDQQRLQARYLGGATTQGRISGFLIDLRQAALFRNLLQKPHAIWVNEANQAELWPLLPAAFKELIDTDTFYAMSVFVDQTPIGVFYADRLLAGEPLDEASFERFQALCRTAAHGIESIRRRTQST